MNRKTFHAVTIALLLGPLAASIARSEEPVSLLHVHGLSFSADGKELTIPSHVGLAIYEAGKWRQGRGPSHDYMGYSGTRDALYSSGHPAPGSGLVNPFGLIKSTDGGNTWRKLGLEGESDFHTMTAGYGTNAVYVFNPQANSRMPSAGVYFTRTDGQKWQRAEARGLRGELNGLAAHPTNPAIVAAATSAGLYLSRDAGTSFEPLLAGHRVLAATFDMKKDQLWFSSFHKQPMLSTVALTTGAKPQLVTLPVLVEDAVSQIAQNPLRPQEIAIASFKRNVFISNDGGRSWTRIAKEGATTSR